MPQTKTRAKPKRIITRGCVEFEIMYLTPGWASEDGPYFHTWPSPDVKQAIAGFAQSHAHARSGWVRWRPLKVTETDGRTITLDTPWVERSAADYAAFTERFWAQEARIYALHDPVCGCLTCTHMRRRIEQQGTEGAA